MSMNISSMLNPGPGANEEQENGSTQPAQTLPPDAGKNEETIYGQSLPFPSELDGSQEGTTVKQEAPEPVLITSTSMPTPTMKDETLDEETRKAIAAARSDLGMRSRAPPPKLSTDVTKSSSPAPTPTDSAPPKKRPAPKSATRKPPSSANGVKRPPQKKRRLEVNSSNRGTPSRRSESGTPTVDAGEEEDPGTDTDPDQVYCICRKPDNHTWMLGCDGGCDDWFHGKCVNMRKEDEPLIDHFICPNCEAIGKGVTTWMPMCRRDGCRNPARVKLKKSGKGATNAPSKYCSDGCGILFMKATLARSPSASLSNSSRRTNHNRNDEKNPIGPLGGPIRPSDLKSLVTSTNDIDGFRSLGNEMYHLPTPPASQSPDLARTNNDSYYRDDLYTSSEAQRLNEIAARKTQLRQQKLLYKDRQHFVTLVKERITREAERLGAAVREFCWYDPRVAWDDVTFASWRESEEGKTAFDSNTLLAPPSVHSTNESSFSTTLAGAPNTDSNETKPTTSDNDDSDHDKDKDKSDKQTNSNQAPKSKPKSKSAKQKVQPSDLPPDLCSNKACRRHQGWQKMAHQDARFEEACVGDEMRRIDAEEREMKRTAELRNRYERVALAKGGGEDDGVVEIIG